MMPLLAIFEYGAGCRKCPFGHTDGAISSFGSRPVNSKESHTRQHSMGGSDADISHGKVDLARINGLRVFKRDDGRIHHPEEWNGYK